MIEIAQSSLVTLVAAAVLSSSLLAFAAYEGSAAQDVALDAALDGLARAIADAGCGPARPASTIDLSGSWADLRDRVSGLVLLPDHLRATEADGSAHLSLEFPRLALQGPVDLLGRLSLDLSWDPVFDVCTARAS